MALGEESDGTLYLSEVPNNLRNSNESELQIITNFFDREIEKCNYMKERRAIRKEEYQEMQK